MLDAIITKDNEHFRVMISLYCPKMNSFLPVHPSCYFFQHVPCEVGNMVTRVRLQHVGVFKGVWHTSLVSQFVCSAQYICQFFHYLIKYFFKSRILDIFRLEHANFILILWGGRLGSNTCVVAVDTATGHPKSVRKRFESNLWLRVCWHVAN